LLITAEECLFGEPLVNLVLCGGEAVKRAGKGVVRAKVLVDFESGKIVEALVSGDFIAYPEDTVWRLEAFLKGAPISEVPARVTAALEGARLVGCTLSDFADAILDAVKKAGGTV
jgi:hypothetical protein